MNNYEKIEEIRSSIGVNKKTMAESLGVSARQYSYWARDDAPEKYIAIAKKMMTIDEVDTIKAIYESKRSALLNSFVLEYNNLFDELGIMESNDNLDLLRERMENRYDLAYVFAYRYRMYPFFTEDFPEKDPFQYAYKINYSFISEVLSHIDNAARNQKALTFYQLEDLCGGREFRHDIIQVIHYLRISGDIGEKIILNLLSYCPAEAHHLEHENEVKQLFNLKIGEF